MHIIRREIEFEISLDRKIWPLIRKPTQKFENYDLEIPIS